MEEENKGENSWESKEVRENNLRIMYGISSWKKNNQFMGILQQDSEKAKVLKKVVDLSSIRSGTVKMLYRLLKEGKIASDLEAIHLEEENKKPKKDQIPRFMTNTDQKTEDDEDDRLTLKEKLLRDANNILEEAKFETLKETLDFKSYNQLKGRFLKFERKKEIITEKYEKLEKEVTKTLATEDPTGEKKKAKLEEIKSKKDKELKDLDEEEEELQSELKYSFEEFLQIIKFFILSPIEKKYIESIETELKRSETLDSKISELNECIKAENHKRRKEANHLKSDKENPEKLLREIVIYENKLEKAHQKLNTTISQNTQLREKINVLRKEKNVIEDIYNKLKIELEKKREEIESTIINAGRAYINRNNAEKKLEILQENAEEQKKNFELECEKLNQSIEKEKKFKKFLKEKQKEELELKRLKDEIVENERIIKEKTMNNEAIRKEYKQSSEKELQIKEAFERISKETGIKDCKDLVEVFKELHLKNTRMNSYVKDLSNELEEIDRKIAEVKEKISKYNTRGATKDIKKHEMKVNLSQKIVQEEKKKQILKVQYEKSLECMNVIKDYLGKLLESVGIPSDKIENLKNSAVTEENLMEYFGILEEKGIEIVSEYSRLIAEQIKHDKGDQHEIEQQISNLVNIIQYENANILQSFLKEYPSKEDITAVYNFEGDAPHNPEQGLMSRDALYTIALNDLRKKNLVNSMNKSTLSAKLKPQKIKKQGK